MNYENQIKKQSVFARVLVALLIAALAMGMTPMLPGSGVYAADQQNDTALTTEKPEIAISGTGIIADGTYTKENISNEVAYTIEELQALAKEDTAAAPKHQYLYSTINTQDTKSMYLEEGIRIEQVLAKSQVTNLAQKVVFESTDQNYATFNPAQTGLADKENAKTSQSLDKERYYFPKFAGITDPEADKTQVPTVLAWAEGGSKGEVKEPTEVKPLDYLKVAAGQLAATDYNNPLFNKYLKKVQVGEAVNTSVLKINDKSYTRADLLLKERADRSYTHTNSNNETSTDYVRGIPASVLFKGCSDDTVVKLFTADNYVPEGTEKTVKELKDDNCIFGYASGTKESDLTGIFATDKNNAQNHGYVTLFGDTMKQLKMVDRITYEEPQTPEEPTYPDAPVVQSAKAGVNSAALKWSEAKDTEGYKILQGSSKEGEYKEIKEVNPSTLSYTVKSLTAEKTVYFKIRAYKTVDEKLMTADSDVVAVTPKLATVALKVKAGSKKAVLSWNKVKDASGYKLYRATAKTGKYTGIKTITKGTTTTYTNTNLKKGKTYYFKARAYKKVGSKVKYGAYSAVKSVKVK